MVTEKLDKFEIFTLKNDDSDVSQRGIRDASPPKIEHKWHFQIAEKNW